MKKVELNLRKIDRVIVKFATGYRVCDLSEDSVREALVKAIHKAEREIIVLKEE